jgi:hypothetical protein
MKRFGTGRLIFLSLLILTLTVSCAGTGFASRFNYTVKTLTLKQKKEKMSIDFKYPRFTYLENKSSQDILNNAVKSFVDKTVADFRKDFEGEQGSEGGSGFAWYLSYEYELPVKSKDLVGIIFRGSIYTGGAHPAPDIRTMLYDFRNKRQVLLKDFFKDKTDYLKHISGYCQREILSRGISDKDWVERGAGPSDDNFRLYYISRKGITVIFPPYQVAAYVNGPQEVDIPWNTMEDIIDTDGAAGWIINFFH